jgi:hypothetical protein
MHFQEHPLKRQQIRTVLPEPIPGLTFLFYNVSNHGFAEHRYEKTAENESSLPGENVAVEIFRLDLLIIQGGGLFQRISSQ